MKLTNHPGVAVNSVRGKFSERVVRVSPGVFAGAEPKDASALEELVQMGVTTIVSVDGIRPNVDLARKHGLRYIHIPIGYDGVPVPAIHMLEQITTAAYGTVYVHCHHGTQRAPTAAAILAMARKTIDRKAARDAMTRAGTKSDYAGLWASVATYEKSSKVAPPMKLVSVAKVTPLSATMARIDRAMDSLDQAMSADDTSTARQQTLLLHELFRESVRMRRSYHPVNMPGKTADKALDLGLSSAAKLADQLIGNLRQRDATTAKQNVRLLRNSCTGCHAKHRD